MAKQKRPRDPNQLAKFILDQVTGESPKESTKISNKNPNAVELGRKGGKVGGAARAAKLTKEQRADIAKKAAEKRWNKPKN